MIEIPEAAVLANQINNIVFGKKIKNVVAAQSPHKFAWFYGDPADYNVLLSGKTIGRAESFGGYVEISAEDAVILFGEGVNLRFYGTDEKRPQKHQLLIEFEDLTAISASIQMYGGMWCFKRGSFDNPYYLNAKEKVSPLSESFDREYFNNIISAADTLRLSTKALLATEQRIPGLGNGVLQDILFNAKVHPKKKITSFTESDKEALFNSIKTTLKEMLLKGGRDTEKDLFGNPGGYISKLSRNTVGRKCDECTGTIKKVSYLGGSIYYCTECQKL